LSRALQLKDQSAKDKFKVQKTSSKCKGQSSKDKFKVQRLKFKGQVQRVKAGGIRAGIWEYSIISLKCVTAILVLKTI
jgi:hypothetical protein